MNKSVLVIEERIKNPERWRRLLKQFLPENDALVEFYFHARMELNTKARVFGIRLSYHFLSVNTSRVIKTTSWFVKQLREEGIIIWVKSYPKSQSEVTIMFLIPTLGGSRNFTRKNPIIHINYRFIRAVEVAEKSRIFRKWKKQQDL